MMHPVGSERCTCSGLPVLGRARLTTSSGRVSPGSSYGVAQAPRPTPVTAISQSPCSRGSRISFGDRPAAMRRDSREHQVRDGPPDRWCHDEVPTELKRVRRWQARPPGSAQQSP
jgi:hypothetical protein